MWTATTAILPFANKVDFKGKIDIEALADDLIKRRVVITKLSNNTVTVESTKTDKKFAFELTSRDDTTSAEISGWHVSNFRDLRRAILEIRAVFELDKQFDQSTSIIDQTTASNT